MGVICGEKCGGELAEVLTVWNGTVSGVKYRKRYVEKVVIRYVEKVVMRVVYFLDISKVFNKNESRAIKAEQSRKVL